MGKATSQRLSEDSQRLLALVEEQEDGMLLTYEEVEAQTGVIMNDYGKDKLRVAILRAGLEYSVLPTVGYRLASPDTAMQILTHQLVTIDSRVRRANRAQTVIQKQFLDALKPEEQRAVTFLGAVFGAIRLAAENGKKIYAPTRPALANPPLFIDVPG